jgi:hypothetical protein
MGPTHTALLLVASAACILAFSWSSAMQRRRPLLSPVLLAQPDNRGDGGIQGNEPSGLGGILQGVWEAT